MCISQKLLIAIIFAISISANLTAQSGCDNPLVITDIDNPPVITTSTCIEFDASITDIPVGLYDAANNSEKGGENVVGVIGEKIIHISRSAFAYNQIAELSLPKVGYIGYDAFLNNQITELSLPNAKYILSTAFAYNQIVELSLPNVEYIYGNAFAYNQITELVLPKITYIGEFAFYSNPITKLSCPYVENIGQEAFAYNQITEIYLPNVDTIADNAFAHNRITELSLPKVEYIGLFAFAYNRITELSLPNIEYIPTAAFYDNQIKKLSLPKVITVRGGAFEMNQIAELSLPKVEYIGFYAFYGNQITELFLPNVITIDEGVFRNNPLRTVTLGTAFTEPTIIEANKSFEDVKTWEADLILGEFVLPERDGNMWNGYIWKSITILGIEENSIATHLTISPNPTYSDAIISFSLLESRDITFEICDISGNVLHIISNFYDAGEHSEFFDTKELVSGSYLCRMLLSGKQIGIEKFAIVR